LYIPLWLLFAYMFIRIIGFKAESSSGILLGPLYFIEFGVHEASHIIVGFLPAILVAAAGSFGEMTFTWLIVLAAWRKKAYYWMIFGLLWVMLSMNSAGRYMADAVPQKLPLVGPGPDPQHDWHFVFSHLHWLPASVFIGDTVRVVGDIAGLAGLALGFWIIIVIAAGPDTNTYAAKTAASKPRS